MKHICKEYLIVASLLLGFVGFIGLAAYVDSKCSLRGECSTVLMPIYINDVITLMPIEQCKCLK